MRDRKVDKTYIAVVEGRPKEEKGRIVNYLTRDRKDRRRFRVSPQDSGKKAVTNYELLKHDGARGMSVVKVNIETGRTHQIRVHMASLGCPVVNDVEYGGGKRRRTTAGGRMLLHCWRMGWEEKEGRREWEADIEQGMRKVVEDIGAELK